MRPKRVTEPEVFHVATTSLAPDVDSFLEAIGAGGWKTDADDDHSALVEIAGRACYRSFGTKLNKNVTRVREGNREYIGSGILKSHHGSVLEHAYDSFALVGVSRVLTHELVRHRAGAAFSQESGRYVRIDEMSYYQPTALSEEYLKLVSEAIEPGSSSDVRFGDWKREVQSLFDDAMKFSQDYVLRLESALGLDEIKDFNMKKKLQSAVRRVAPEGKTTTIIVTANHRAWRHIVSMRTAEAAEEEVRLCQWRVFQKLRELHPNIYQDAVVAESSTSLPRGVPTVSFDNEKV